MYGPNVLRITVEPVQDAQLIRVAGELDVSNVAMLRSELDPLREEEATTLLDLADVTFIDSAGLQLLLAASRSSATSDWAFFILRPSKVVQRLIQLSRTGDLLTLASA